MIQGKTGLESLVKAGLLEGAIDAALQTQVNGLELTVARVEAFYGPGRVGFDNADRALPMYKELEWGRDGWLFLREGCYKIVFNEIVSIPMDMCAIARPRSSLLRMGATVETAVWDAGYKGRSEALLIVHNPSGFYIKKDARVVQLLFMRLDSAVQQGYSGRYMNENIN
ncbi:MAG: deoxyuridine 5'-triphosphate nucleotidohydrolase [Methanocella sp.]